MQHPNTTTRRTAVLLAAAIALSAASAQAFDARSSPWIQEYFADYTAMSAAPRSPAMDKWLAHYAPYAFFEDATLSQRGSGHQRIRESFTEAFTGALGPVRWTVLRHIAGADWNAVDGWLDGTQSGKPYRVRFTSWFKRIGGRIVHQIDYVDYDAAKRQVSGSEALPSIAPEGAGSRRGGGKERALRTVAEFYRRYEAMPVLSSTAHYLELLTEDYSLEDPTGRILYDSRARIQKVLNAALALREFGEFHWDIDRQVTDGEWVALEGSWRGLYKGRPFATRFATWLRLRDGKIARHIDFMDYPTFRRMTSPGGTAAR
jgi:ketosteroid isomerase-like protein